MSGKRKRPIQNIGRRTGVDVIADKSINLQEGNYEDYNDYWTQSECSTPFSRSSEKPGTSTPDNAIAEDYSLTDKTTFEKRQRFTKGRRTGVDLLRDKNIKMYKNVEDYCDYWTDTNSEIANESENEKPLNTSSPSTSRSKSCLVENEMQTDSNYSVPSPSSCVSPSWTTSSKSSGSIKLPKLIVKDSGVSVPEKRKRPSKSNVSASQDSNKKLPLSKILPKKTRAKKKNPVSSKRNKSDTENIVSGNINDCAVSNQLTSEYSLKSPKKEKSSILKHSESSKCDENSFDSARTLINVDAKCSSSSDHLPSTLEQVYHKSKTCFTSSLSSSKSKKSEQSGTNSGRNKIAKTQQSEDTNISSISVANKENDKTFLDEGKSAMPKSRNSKRTATVLSNVNDANFEKIVEVDSLENLCEPFLRRSDRSRIGVLQHWRNERRQFNYKSEEIFYKKGEPDHTFELLSKKIARKPKNSNKKEKLPDNSVNLHHIQKTIKETAIINPNTGEDEYVYLHRPYSSLLWSSLQPQDLKNSSFQFTKCFNAEDISFGYIEINVKERKYKQYSPIFNITFNVVKGQVQVTVNKRKIKLNELDTITIPISNIYSIDNIGNRKAVLFFCTFKAPMFQFQVSAKEL